MIIFTQFGEERSDVCWKQIVILQVLFEAQVDQCLRDMPDGVVDGLGDRLVNWLAIERDPRARFEWHCQHTAAQAPQDVLVAIDRLGRRLDPPRHIMGEFLNDCVGHGLN